MISFKAKRFHVRSPSFKAPVCRLLQSVYGRPEGFTAEGLKIDPQIFQVTGEFTWVVESLGASKFEITQTGSAKFSNSNTVDLEINCNGARDRFNFELTKSSTVSGLSILESGCPQGIKGVTATQMSFANITSNSFSYILATQADGARAIETYTFTKN